MNKQINPFTVIPINRPSLPLTKDAIIKSDVNVIPCLHDKCIECYGTGKKKDGSPCIHYLSCNCAKCAPHY